MVRFDMKCSMEDILLMITIMFLHVPSINTFEIVPTFLTDHNLPNNSTQSASLPRCEPLKLYPCERQCVFQNTPIQLFGITKHILLRPIYQNNKKHVIWAHQHGFLLKTTFQSMIFTLHSICNMYYAGFIEDK